jgi:hypothetical protein
LAPPSLAKSGRTLSVGSSMTRKSNMIPTAFSVASAIYSEIGASRPTSSSIAPTPSPHFRQVPIQSINVHSSGRDKYAPPAWRPFDALRCRSVARRCKDATPVTARHQKESAGDVEMT